MTAKEIEESIDPVIRADEDHESLFMKNVEGEKSHKMMVQMSLILAERMHGNSRANRNAKSLCDSGIVTPYGNPTFSSLLSVSHCKQSSGHVVGPDYVRNCIPIMKNKSKKRKSRSSGKKEHDENKTDYVGSVTFNQIYEVSPSSLVVCTSCNRTDYHDRITNLGMVGVYTHPQHSVSKKCGEVVYDESYNPHVMKSLEDEDNKQPLTSLGSLTSRAYISKARVPMSGETDVSDIGDPMCLSGCSFGLSYLGSMKVNGLSCEIYDPNCSLKRKTIRYSVAKLLRQKLPKILNNISSGTEEFNQKLRFWKPFYSIIFCSFEHTRQFLSKKISMNQKEHDEHVFDLLQFLKTRLTNQFIWIYQTIEFRQPKEMEENGCNTQQIVGLCSCRIGEIIRYFEKSDGDETKQALLNVMKKKYDMKMTLNNKKNAFYHWRELFDPPQSENMNPSTYDANKDDWKGPWYKSTQTMDEDEMSFFNLDLRYISEVTRWCNKRLHQNIRMDKMQKKEEKHRDYSVVATLLLKLYIANDIMRVLSPSKHKMERLLLQMFVDQMIDLSNWIISSCSQPNGHLRHCHANKKRQRFGSAANKDIVDPLYCGLISDIDTLKSKAEQKYKHDKEGNNEKMRREWKKNVRKCPSDLVRPYDIYYPHGRRFIWSGELPSTGHLFSLADLWTKHRPVGESIGCLINHVLICKSQPHTCQIRSLSTVIDKNKDEMTSLIYLILDIVFIHLMGMYPNNMHRPCWRARSVLRSQFLEFATRDKNKLIYWIKNNQHLVHNAIKEHMYYQLENIPSLRALFVETSWHVENEIMCRKAGEFSRAIISDKLSYGFLGLSSRISTQSEMNEHTQLCGIDDNILKRFNVDAMHIKEGTKEYETFGFRIRPKYCPRPPRTREKIYPNLLEGYKKRLHMNKVNDMISNYLKNTMVNQEIFSLVDMLNEEYLIKGREYQTKLRKGTFWQQLQSKLIKFISSDCAYVLDLGLWEQICSESTTEEEKEKIEKSMIKNISSYTSNVFSVMECNGILSGNHIRAIKAVAYYAAKKKPSCVIDFNWLISVGVSLGTISYLYFMYYAYEYHDLPDNRIKNDIPYLFNKMHKVPKKKKIYKTKRKNIDLSDEQFGQKLCYGSMKIPYEPWMDYSIVDYHREYNEHEKTNKGKKHMKKEKKALNGKYWLGGVVRDKKMHAVLNEYHRMKENRSPKTNQKKKFSCPKKYAYYVDDEDEYIEEEKENEIEWRNKKVKKTLKRNPTTGEMDIAIICVFLHFYEHSDFFQTVKLTKDVARNQIRALRCRYSLLPHNKTPPDIGKKRFCGCGRAFNPVISGPEYMISMHFKGELAAYDLLRKEKRCAVRNTRFCDKPPMVIDMIGKSVRVGKTWYVICVICGLFTIWRRESYCELGPTCGCHAAPLRSPSKYPMSFVALIKQKDMKLRQHLLNNGFLMNGWVQCGYCKEFIIPGKEINLRIWDDMCDICDDDEHDDNSYKDRPDKTKQLEDWFNNMKKSSCVQKVSKTERCRLTIMPLCKDHLKHIGWKIRQFKIYSKRKFMNDLTKIIENEMKLRMSSRFARAT